MLNKNLSRELKELSLLFEISTKLSETLDLKAVLKPILQMTAEYMEIPRGTLTILNRNRGEIVIEEFYYYARYQVSIPIYSNTNSDFIRTAFL